MFLLWSFYAELVFAGVGEYRESHEPQGEYCTLEIGPLAVELFFCAVLPYDQLTVWNGGEELVDLYRTKAGISDTLDAEVILA